MKAACGMPVGGMWGWGCRGNVCGRDPIFLLTRAAPAPGTRASARRAAVVASKANFCIFEAGLGVCARAFGRGGGAGSVTWEIVVGDCRLATGHCVVEAPHPPPPCDPCVQWNDFRCSGITAANVMKGESGVGGVRRFLHQVWCLCLSLCAAGATCLLRSAAAVARSLSSTPPLNHLPSFRRAPVYALVLTRCVCHMYMCVRLRVCGCVFVCLWSPAFAPCSCGHHGRPEHGAFCDTPLLDCGVLV
jgi:hypothetical protein